MCDQHARFLHCLCAVCVVCCGVAAGRVKTLHPGVHGGILAIRGNPAHMDAIKQHNIQTIDLVRGEGGLGGVERGLWEGCRAGGVGAGGEGCKGLFRAGVYVCVPP